MLTSIFLVLYSALCPDMLTFTGATGRIFIQMSRWRIFSLLNFFEKTVKIKTVTWGNLVQRWMANWQTLWTTKLPVACRWVHGNREWSCNDAKIERSIKKCSMNRTWAHILLNLCRQPGHKSKIQRTDFWATTPYRIMVYLVQWNCPFPLSFLNLEDEVQKQSGNLLYVKTGFLVQSVTKIHNIGLSISISKLIGLYYLCILFFIV